MSGARIPGVVLFITLVCAPLAAAQEGEQDARTLFEAGRVSYDHGRFELALEQFREAYRLSQRPLLLYNIATTLDRLRRDEEALATYRQFLEEAPDADIAPRVREQMRILEERLAQPDGPDEEQTAIIPAEPEPTPERESSGSVLTEWWLWTLIGVVVLGGVGVAVGFAVGSGEQLQPPIASANGIVFEL